MVVEADERRLAGRPAPSGSSTQPWPQPTSATRAPRSSLADDAVERGQPRADEVRGVAGPEEALAAVVDVVDVLVPADAVAAAHGLLDPRRVDHRAERDLEEAGQERRAVLVGERDRLLGRQRVAAARPGRTRRSRPRPARSATRARSARPCRCAPPARRASAGPRRRARGRGRACRPITTSAAFSVAPTSSTALNTNCSSFCMSSAAGSATAAIVASSSVRRIRFDRGRRTASAASGGTPYLAPRRLPIFGPRVPR